MLLVATTMVVSAQVPTGGSNCPPNPVNACGPQAIGVPGVPAVSGLPMPSGVPVPGAPALPVATPSTPAAPTVPANPNPSSLPDPRCAPTPVNACNGPSKVCLPDPVNACQDLPAVPNACVSLSLAFNDCFNFPGYIGQSPYVAVQNADTSTLEPGETVPPCIWNFWQGGTVWYRFTPTEAGMATVSTTFSTPNAWGYEPGIVVYTGSSLDDLTQVGCNGTVGPPAWTIAGPVSFQCVPGTTYQIALVSYSPGWMPFGDVTLHLSGCDGSGSIDVAPTVQALVPCLPAPLSLCLGDAIPALPTLPFPAVPAAPST